MSNLSRKFWEAPTKIKEGYLEKEKEKQKEEPPKVMEIRNGKVISWRPQ